MKHPPEQQKPKRHEYYYSEYSDFDPHYEFYFDVAHRGVSMTERYRSVSVYRISTGASERIRAFSSTM